MSIISIANVFISFVRAFVTLDSTTPDKLTVARVHPFPQHRLITSAAAHDETARRPIAGLITHATLCSQHLHPADTKFKYLNS